MAFKTTFLCPYCFETHDISKVQFRCVNMRCKDFDDIEMTKYENGNINIPKQGKKTFTAPMQKGLKVPKFANCPECSNKTYKHICPSCHNQLPESSIEGKSMIISVIGSRSTGKSHFVGVVIKELMDRIAISFGGSVEGFGDSFKRWETNFANSLYNKQEKLGMTTTSILDVNNGAYRPFIFKLKLKQKMLFKEVLESFTFVFFDTAGEDLNSEDVMRTVNKYISKSSGIVFLLDPMQIPSVTSQLEDDVVKRAGGLDPQMVAKSDDIMTRVSNLIRDDRGLSENAKIDIPIAAVFSKFDAIETIVPKDFSVHNPSPHCASKKFDMTDWHNVNQEMVSLLKEWDADSFIAQVETNYKRYSYFAISSLGLKNNPTAKTNKIQKPRPHRVEDPILWIFKENGILKGK